MPRIIAHIDMDAFFASVEERDHPWMQGMPIVVGADPEDGSGRGVVSTANYIARKYGIHSAMPIRTAWNLAQKAKNSGGAAVLFVTPSPRRYAETSARIIGILNQYSDAVEVASIDEAYLDLSSSATYTKAVTRAKQIKKIIHEQEGLTASVGIGPNKLIAKIASDRKKPDGLSTVMPEQIHAFLGPLPIRVIPGVGPKAEAIVFKLGARSVSDVRKIKKETLVKLLGSGGNALYKKVRGEDDTPLALPSRAQSIGEQETLREDTVHPDVILQCLQNLAEGIVRRMKQSGVISFRTVVLVVRFENFETHSRSHTLTEPVYTPDVLVHEGIRLMLPFLDRRENVHQRNIRLVGLRIEKLCYREGIGRLSIDKKSKKGIA
ncbi:MAG: DNA polymerase IV [Minisyncoccota bacterium]